MRTGNEAKKSALKYDEYSHGLDYLTFGLSDKKIIDWFFTKRIENLDNDNSNFWAVQVIDEIFSIQKYKAPTWQAYQFSCVYNSVSIPIFEITEFSELQSEFTQNQWGVIHFYWAFFRLLELEWFSDELVEYIDSCFLDSPISRFDYRFDFCSYDEIVDVPTPDQVFPNIRKNKKRKLYQVWPRLQSWELWNKSNKTIFIRLYNKLDELEWNLKKTYLYWDLDKFKTYTRLEYEFWKKYCNGYKWKDIEQLINKAFKTSWIEPSTFKWNLYKPTTKLDLSDKVGKLRYIKIFKTMAINLRKNWIDPISLIKE